MDVQRVDTMCFHHSEKKKVAPKLSFTIILCLEKNSNSVMLEESINLTEGYTLSYLIYKSRNKFILKIAKLFMVSLRK